MWINIFFIDPFHFLMASNGLRGSECYLFFKYIGFILFLLEIRLIKHFLPLKIHWCDRKLQDWYSWENHFNLLYQPMNSWLCLNLGKTKTKRKFHSEWPLNFLEFKLICAVYVFEGFKRFWRITLTFYQHVLFWVNTESFFLNSCIVDTWVYWCGISNINITPQSLLMVPWNEVGLSNNSGW